MKFDWDVGPRNCEQYLKDGGVLSPDKVVELLNILPILLDRAENLAGISGGGEHVWRDYITPLDEICAQTRRALGK